eukprot:g7070.t1
MWGARKLGFVAFCLMGYSAQAGSTAATVHEETSENRPSGCVSATIKNYASDLAWIVPIAAVGLGTVLFPPAAPVAGLPAAAGAGLQVARVATLALPMLSRVIKKDGDEVAKASEFDNVTEAEEAEEAVLVVAPEEDDDYDGADSAAPPVEDTAGERTVGTGE